MGNIKLFVQHTCSRCPQAKQVGASLKEEGFQIMEYDVGTPDGLAEAAFYSVQATPTFILEDRHEKVVADFRGEVPTMQTIKEIMSGI
ncbi:MAG: thioredoxin family protein [Pseudomonadota bacterium]